MLDGARYAVLIRHFLGIATLAFLMAFCGCESWYHQPDKDAVKLILYQPNKKPLASLQPLLPWNVSTNWSTGQWRGTLSGIYMRPPDHHVLTNDLLNAPSWRPLRCLIDKDNPGFIYIDLQPAQPRDSIRISIPLRKLTLLQSSWYHWTEGGGGEGGTVRILQR